MVTWNSPNLVSVTQELPLLPMFAQSFKTEALSTTHNMFAESQMLTANTGAAGEHCQWIQWAVVQKGWSLSISRHDSAHLALIYFPLRKVHMVQFAATGPAQLQVQHPGMLALNAPAIWPGVTPPETFPRSPSPCQPLCALWAMRHGPPPRAGRRGEDGDSGKKKGVPGGCGSPAPQHQPCTGIACHRGWVTFVRHRWLLFLSPPELCLTACPYAGSLAALGTQGAVCLWSDGEWLLHAGTWLWTASSGVGSAFPSPMSPAFTTSQPWLWHYALPSVTREPCYSLQTWQCSNIGLFGTLQMNRAACPIFQSTAALSPSLALTLNWEFALLLWQLHFYFHAVLPVSQPEDSSICRKATPLQASFPWCLITLRDIEIAKPGTALWSLSSCDFKGAERDAVLKAFLTLFLGRKEREQPALIKSLLFFFFLKRSPHAKIWFKEH